ncbi:LamG-like jellyroll fold domain-containing protein [Mucilaginibacter angelicae]|uniref:LamG-like jellyroll fold domain-containing protein n=1 Tax=Mucilaginibacter angelicae TaxID=869718 RepID=A0ABV6LAY5_9SPHI
MKKRIPFLGALIIIAIYSACNKEHHDPVPQPVKLQSITITDTLTAYIGNVLQMDLKVDPTSFDTSKFSWQSSDTSIVSVSKTGKITVKNEGISKLSVTDSAKTKSATCLVTVKDSLSIGLLAYYPFNNSLNDFSPYKNDGKANDISSTADKFGKANSAFYFNGLSSHIAVKDNQALRLSNTNITLSAWVKLDVYNYSYGVNILTKHHSGVENGWAWGITGYGFGTPGIVTYGTGGGSAAARGTRTISLNQWHLVTSVYDLSKQQLSIYVDGTFDNVTNNMPAPNMNTDADLYIGRDNPDVSAEGYLVRGSVDEVRIYHRALSAYEIHKLFVSKKY